MQPEDAVAFGDKLAKYRGKLTFRVLLNLIPLIGSVLLATAHLWDGASVLIPLALGAACLIAYLVVSESTLTAIQGREDARECKMRIGDMLEIALDFLWVAKAQVRATVMLPIDADGQVLRGSKGAQSLKMKYHTTGFTEAERKMRWTTGEGCAGQAWDQTKPVLGAETDGVAADLTVPEQGSVTVFETRLGVKQTLKTILSVPIVTTDRRRFGVLNFDDIEPAASSMLGRAEAIVAARKLADRIGHLLEAKNGWEG